MAVATGLENFLRNHLEVVRGKRVGVLCHPASVNSRLQHIVDLFLDQAGINLTAILGPQHGFRGETQDNMIEWEGYTDQRSKLPVYSLYGEFRQPTGEMLQEVDVLICDLQDVGARYYTFVYTMALAMEACRQNDREFIVLDRPNPIGGLQIEGPVLDPSYRSFVGLYPLPVRHGMTIGELALFFNHECSIDCKLDVIPMEGWKRGQYFDETGLLWVPPSPNMPSLNSALVYPGGCLLEGTNVSEGRGSTLPFEISGAPWIEPAELVSRLERVELPGVLFRPLYFTPTFHKWKDEVIGGIQVHVTDRELFQPFLTGLALIQSYCELGPGEFQWKAPPYEYEYQLLPFDILCGTNRIRQMIEDGMPLPEIEASWQKDLAEFLKSREKYLLYPEN